MRVTEDDLLDEIASLRGAIDLLTDMVICNEQHDFSEIYDTAKKLRSEFKLDERK